MVAVLLATGLDGELKALNERYPTPMIPLLDRPFIQHVIEVLVEQGLSRFEIVLSHLPEKVETYLGDGSRWGSSFRFHLARNPENPYETLRSIDFGFDIKQVLLAHADRLPLIQLSDLREMSKSMLFCESRREYPNNWSGWALLPIDILKKLPSNANESKLAEHLMKGIHNPAPKLVETSLVLDFRSYKGILAAHKAVLAGQFEGLMIGAKEVEDGIWLSRNVSLHPTVKLSAPVYIGEDCRIERGGELGPYAVVEHDSILESGCTVRESVVFPRSYVGEALELNEVLVDRNRLINVRLGAVVAIADEFILGEMSAGFIKSPLFGLSLRCTGMALLLLSAPLLALTALILRLFRRGPVLFKKEAVRLPASTDESLWQTFEQWSFYNPEEVHLQAAKQEHLTGFRHFLLAFLPGLINVVKGELRFVGVASRTRGEILDLNDDWRALYLRTKAGLITEAFVQYGAKPTEDELYAAQAFYSAKSGFIYDLKLAMGYLEKICGK